MVPRSRNAKTATRQVFFANLMSDENVVDYNHDDGHDDEDGGDDDDHDKADGDDNNGGDDGHNNQQDAGQ